MEDKYSSLPEIKLRKMKFDFTDSNVRTWLNNNNIDSHLMNSLALFIIAGEEFIIDIAKVAKKRVTNPFLLERINLLQVQEALHTQVHLSYNKKLEEEGFELEKGLEDYFSFFRPFFQKNKKNYSRLIAGLCGAEHFTALFADALLGDIDKMSITDKNIGSMWIWHATEEIEHKSVSDECAVDHGVSYFMKVKTLIEMSVFLIPMLLRVQQDFIRQDNRNNGNKVPSLWYLGIRAFRPGGVLQRIPFNYIRAFVPGFDPWKIDNRNLINVGEDKVMPGHFVKYLASKS